MLIVLVVNTVVLVILGVFGIHREGCRVNMLATVNVGGNGITVRFLARVFTIAVITIVVNITVNTMDTIPIAGTLLRGRVSSARSRDTRVSGGFNESGNNDFNNENGKCTPAVPKMRVPSDNRVSGLSSGKVKFVNGIFNRKTTGCMDRVSSTVGFAIMLRVLKVTMLLALISKTISVLFMVQCRPLGVLTGQSWKKGSVSMLTLSGVYFSCKGGTHSWEFVPEV